MQMTPRAEEWKRIFAEYEAAGVTRKAFCSERGIKLSTFDYWRSRLRQTAKSRAQVVKVGTMSKVVPPIRIRIGERVTVELDGAAEEGQLQRVLRAVIGL
jgi:hypothetical protein